MRFAKDAFDFLLGAWEITMFTLHREDDEDDRAQHGDRQEREDQERVHDGHAEPRHHDEEQPCRGPGSMRDAATARP
jgi:hypothetical protein